LFQRAKELPTFARFFMGKPARIFFLKRKGKKMEITIDSLIAILSLLLGSGGGAFFTWRYQQRKAKSEAKAAEAEAERAKFEAMQANAQLIKEIQDSYQQLTADLKANLETQQQYNEEQKQYIAELKEDRRHLRQERDDLRKRQDKTDENVRDLQMKVARYGRILECMRPFLCGRDGCAIRVPVTISDDGEIDPRRQNRKEKGGEA
jgi:flagellar biosynthesis GTPase FlhF